jgi:hypothetical protein
MSTSAHEIDDMIDQQHVVEYIHARVIYIYIYIYHIDTCTYAAVDIYVRGPRRILITHACSAISINIDYRSMDIHMYIRAICILIIFQLF